MENSEIMYEAFRDATKSTREKENGKTGVTVVWSFSDETYIATLDWKDKYEYNLENK